MSADGRWNFNSAFKGLILTKKTFIFGVMSMSENLIFKTLYLTENLPRGI